MFRVSIRGNADLIISLFHSFLWKRKEIIYREREKKSDRGNEYVCSETKVTFHILSGTEMNL